LIGPIVLDAQLVEQRAGDHQGAHQHLDLFGQFEQGPTHPGDGLEDVLDHFLHADIGTPRGQVVQVARDAADIGRDRHLVVVEDDDQPLLHLADMVQRLQGDAAGQGAVADDGHDMVLPSQAIAGDGQARGEAQRGRGVAGIEHVVLALLAGGEAEQPAALADGADAPAAAGDDLVRVALVADVPDDLVARCVEHAVQGQSQVDGPQVGGEMPAVARHHLHQQRADLPGKRRQLAQAEVLDVRRRIDRFQQRHHWLR